MLTSNYLTDKFSNFHLARYRIYCIKWLGIGNCHLLVLKVVMVTHQRRLLTRGLNYSDLTWKLLVFGIVVIEERGLHAGGCCLRSGRYKWWSHRGGSTVCLLMPK